MNPSISLDEAIRIAAGVEAKIVKHRGVAYALSRIGRAELGGDPESVSNNEIYVGLTPEATQRRKALEQELEADLKEIPGLLISFSQPIATRVDELLSGVKAEIAVKLYGEDLDVLAEKGAEIQTLLQGVTGATGVALEQIAGEAQLVVRADRDAVAQQGLSVGEVMDAVANAVGGESLGEVVDGDRRFDIYLRVAAAYRRDPEAIERLIFTTPSGARVPLGRVAQVGVEEGPPLVSHEKGRRRVVVQCNVRGRDLGGFVDEGKRLLDQKVLPSLPAGYVLEWGGQFENQQRAQRRLSIVVPLAIFLIFVLLVLSFDAVRPALLILMNVPFSLIGGVFALFVTGQYLSVPSSIGFIAVFGVAMLNGVVLVSCITQLQRGGKSSREAAVTGALLRMRPVLMTACVATLGLVPLLLSTGIGSEVQRPLATVVVSGRLGAATRVAEKEREVATLDYVWRRREILTDAKRAFVSLLGARRTLALARETRAIAADLQRVATERYNVAAIPQMEVLKTDVNLAGADTNVKVAEKNATVALKALHALLGNVDLPTEKFSGDLAANFSPPTLEALRADVANSHPLLEGVRRARESAELQLEQARAERFPDTELEVTVGRDGENDSLAQAGIAVPLPLFNRNQGKVAAAEVKIRQAELKLRATENDLVRRLGEAYRELMTAQARVSAYGAEILPKAQTTLELTTEGYRQGKFGYLDVLDAQRTLAEAKLSYATALSELNLAAAELEKLAGVRLEAAK